jgi:uncharacterized protein (TIGR00369 family)
MAFGELLGIRVDEDTAEQVTCQIVITPEHLNQALIGHGGVLFSLADLTLGLLMNRDEDSVSWVSTSFAFQLFRGAGIGDVIRARAVVEHGSRSLLSCRVAITRDSDDALVGTLTNQAMRLPSREAEAIDTGRVTVRRTTEDGPLERSLAAARRRRYGQPSSASAHVPVIIDLDGATFG